MRRLAIALACMVLACRAPAAPAPPATVGSEADLFETIRTLYAAHGYPEAWNTTLQLDDDALVPYTASVVVHSRPFLGTATAAHVAQVSRALYHGRLDTTAHFATVEDARDGYRAFMVALLAHEVAHALAFERDVLDFQAMWVEESRAIALELPMLRELARIGSIPARWPALYDQFNRALLAAAPAGVVAHLPPSETGRVALFAADYLDVMNGMAAPVHPHPDKVDRILAAYSQRRVEQYAQAPVPLAQLHDRIPHAREPWRTAAERIVRSTPRAELVADHALTLNLPAIPMQTTIVPDDDEPRTAAITSQLGLVVPASRRPAVAAQLVQIAAAPQHFALAPDGHVTIHGVAHAPDRQHAAALVRTLEAHAALAARWRPVLEQLAR